MPGLARTLLLAGACCALAGCGSASKPEATVRLALTAPTDGARVTSDSITISGSVSPAASVLILGQRVPVARGAFTTRVSLQPGTNIIDVLAGAPHALATMTAVRVYRQVEVTVPDVSGDSPSAADRALQSAGLVARVVNNGQFFDFLIPTSPQVCSSSPGAGRSVAPGSTVTLSVSKTC
jgi:hypothetical protein